MLCAFSAREGRRSRQWVVVVDVGKRAGDGGNDVSPQPGQGDCSVPHVGEASAHDGPVRFRLGLGIVCADQGKDGPVAGGYGEYARCKVRHTVSLNLRISEIV